MIKQELNKILLSKQDIFTDTIGQTNVKHQLKSALLSNRNIIIVGSPGIGKTTLAKNIAKILPEINAVQGCGFHCAINNPICPECKNKKNKTKVKVSGNERFIRIQGSPDLTVEDLLGDIDPIKAMKFGPLSIQAFTPGKIFKANNGVLFFDEINRCPEKLQNALLQVLQEKKATIGSYDVDIPADFLFIATMNPEDSSTERLSDVLLDRFDIIYMSFPETIKIEKHIIKVSCKKLVKTPENLLHLMAYFIRLLRQSDKLEKKPSVRALQGLYERSQANAMLNKKKQVRMQDIRDVLVSVLAHRIKLKPSIKYLMSPEAFLAKEFKEFMKTNVGKELEKSAKGDVP